jgi:hypothetical protein
MPDGTSVAVDEGITWKGVTIYLSLTDELIAVDEKTKKTLWGKSVGAFWRRVSFLEISRGGGRFWVVRLEPAPDETEGKDLVQLHEMGSGEIFMPVENMPSGKRLDAPKTWNGSTSFIPKPFAVAVTTTENLGTLLGRLHARPAELRQSGDPEFNSGKELVLVVSDGESWNCNGIGVESVWRDDQRLLVRLNHLTFQSMGEGKRTRPYGIFVLPRKDGEAIHIERNVQRYIGGPPIWKEVRKIERPADSARELDGLPEGEKRKLPAGK